ncbi:MAG: TetR/AcrR family transcriptional regulator [Firmicutes bacterium]|nr:TetR/AcrR family transcriptional regulator [Bacillota bacterium]HPU01297.1 TetR/AcrR family transcriptional regulator [Bacillota bacterium]
MVKKTGEKYFAILEAAIKTFARYGYHRTRVSDIAREAGVADGTVYIYFEKKEDILISLFQEMMSQFVEGLRQQLAACRNSNEKLATVVSYHLNTLGSRPEQAKVTQIELRQIDETINRGISLPLLNYFRLIEEVIAEGQKEGLYRRNLDVRTARKVIFGAIDEVVTCWTMSKKAYDLGSLAGPVYDLLVRGLQ